jgi:LPS export ABC transporter protein LptC
MNRLKGIFRYIIYIKLLFLALIPVLVSCENNIEVVNAISNPNVLPEMSGTEVEILYSDSARLKARIVAPELNRFRKADAKPYIEFPKGMHVYFYDANKKVNAEVSARYAIYKEMEKLWEARNNVVVVNVKGDKLNTEKLFWNETTQKIYTDTYSKVTTVDGEVSIGERGLTANEDFSSWKLIGASGRMKFRDEER